MFSLIVHDLWGGNESMLIQKLLLISETTNSYRCSTISLQNLMLIRRQADI